MAIWDFWSSKTSIAQWAPHRQTFILSVRFDVKIDFDFMSKRFNKVRQWLKNFRQVSPSYRRITPSFAKLSSYYAKFRQKIEYYAKFRQKTIGSSLFAKFRQEIRYFDWIPNDRLHPTSKFNELYPNFFQYHSISFRQRTPNDFVRFPKKNLDWRNWPGLDG